MSISTISAISLNNHHFHAYIQGSDVSLAWFYPENSNTVVKRYEKLEIGVSLPSEIQNDINSFIYSNIDNQSTINPFLDWEIRVKAIFTHTSGEVKIIDGFYYEEFERVVIPYVGQSNLNDTEYKTFGGYWNNIGTPYKFRVRFAPPLIGEWNCKVKVIIPNNGNPLTFNSGEFDFDVVNSANQGYIKVGDNKQYLKLGNETFMPLGPNLGWPNTYSTLNPQTASIMGTNESYRPFTAPLQSYLDYEENLHKLGDAGANHFRFAMASWSTDIEFEKIGNYYDRLHIAWEIDNILNTAKEENLYMQFNMLMHYCLTSNEYHKVRWDWAKQDDYLFNVNTGSLPDNGYCYRENQHFSLTKPEYFLTNIEAKKYYKQKIRYIISRWGYSTNIEMFELMNEISNIGKSYNNAPNQESIDINGDPTTDIPYDNNFVQNAVESWHNEISSYIKEDLGHNQHLISVSYATELKGDDDSYELPNIDIVSQNVYHNNEDQEFWNKSTKVNWTDGLIKDLADIVDFKKPVVFSETGCIESVNCAQGVSFKKNAWLAPFTGLAFANDWTVWYRPEFWHVYGDIKTFIDQTNFDSENWSAGQYYPNGPWNHMETNDKKVEMVYLLRDDKYAAMGVINNRTYNYYTKGNDSGFCTTEPPGFIFSNPFTSYTSTPSHNGLYVSNLYNLPYKIEYFDENNVLIYTDVKFGPYIEMDFPEITNILAFKISLDYNKSLNITPENEFIDSNYFFEINIFPNPTSENININCNFEKGICKIYNTQGKLINGEFELRKGINHITLLEYKKGIYTIEISTEDFVKTYKLVKI